MTPPVDNLHELPCTPDADTMRRVIDTLFANVGVNGLIEVSWTSAKAPHALDAGELFGLDQFDELVDFAVKKNSIPNCNVYVSAGLRSNGTYLHARAADVNVRRVTAVWADFDALGALQAAHGIAEHLDIPPNLVTFTGKEPHLRGQMWWVLDEPTEDLELHRQIVGAIARRMNGDTSVINPSRVMRFIGGVAWPLKAGRALEMTGILEGGGRAMPYTMEELAGKLTRAGCLAQPEAQIVKPSATVLDFNSAEPTHDLDGLIRQAAEPGQWHKHALLASAHLLGRGTPPDVVVEVLATRLIQPGYTYPDTRNELVVMVKGALRRGFYRAREEEGFGEVGERAVAATRDYPFLTMRALLAQPRPKWLIEQYLSERAMSSLFAPPAAFKSFLALDMALCVAYGLPWHGFATKQCKVLYICAEGQYAFGERILAWTAHRVGGAETESFVVLPVPVNFLEPSCVEQLIDAVQVHLGGVGLVVIDTLARNFGVGDENSTKDMNAYLAGTAKLVEGGAHVMHVHHTGKDAGKAERGSSAFRGALDTSLKLMRDAGADTAVLKVVKQKDGPEANPMCLAFPVVEAARPDTGELVSSRVPTIASDYEFVVESRNKQGLSALQVELLAIVGPEGASLKSIVAELKRCNSKSDRSNIHRALGRLVTRKLVTLDATGYRRVVVREDHQCDD